MQALAIRYSSARTEILFSGPPTCVKRSRAIARKLAAVPFRPLRLVDAAARLERRQGRPCRARRPRSRPPRPGRVALAGDARGPEPPAIAGLAGPRAARTAASPAGLRDTSPRALGIGIRPDEPRRRPVSVPSTRSLPRAADKKAASPDDSHLSHRPIPSRATPGPRRGARALTRPSARLGLSRRQLHSLR